MEFGGGEGVREEAAAENVVQTCYPGRGSFAPAQSSHSRNSARGGAGAPTSPPTFWLLSHQENSHPAVSFKRAQSLAWRPATPHLILVRFSEGVTFSTRRSEGTMVTSAPSVSEVDGIGL